MLGYVHVEMPHFGGQNLRVLSFVSVMHYVLGFIDLEQRTLQPLDNPFGPSLSPMS
jgi:hypothetical protein